MIALRGLVLGLLLVSSLGSTILYAHAAAPAPSSDNELPDLEVDEWDEDVDGAEASNAPNTFYYYDWRSSERKCYSPEEARAHGLSPQGRGKPCK